MKVGRKVGVKEGGGAPGSSGEERRERVAGEMRSGKDGGGFYGGGEG